MVDFSGVEIRADNPAFDYIFMLIINVWIILL